jgi:hypothetical protein
MRQRAKAIIARAVGAAMIVEDIWVDLTQQR